MAVRPSSGLIAWITRKGSRIALSAFELFLQTQPDRRGKVTYLQIAPKSRTEIPEYADMEQEIGSAAGRINGAYGEADWTPIRYVNRPIIGRARQGDGGGEPAPRHLNREEISLTVARSSSI